MKSPTVRFHFMDSKESFRAPPLSGAVYLSSTRLVWFCWGVGRPNYSGRLSARKFLAKLYIELCFL